VGGFAAGRLERHPSLRSLTFGKRYLETPFGPLNNADFWQMLFLQGRVGT